MDLIYKTAGELLVEKKGKGLSEYYKKIPCETEIFSCLIMKDVRKTVCKFSYNPNTILSTVLPVISVIYQDTSTTHGKTQ